jgi:hypothetical protein
MRSHDDAPGRGQFGPDRVFSPVDELRDVLTRAATERALDAADQYLGVARGSILDGRDVTRDEYLVVVDEVLEELRRRLDGSCPGAVLGEVHGVSIGRPDLSDPDSWIRDGHHYVEVRLEDDAEVPAILERVQILRVDPRAGGSR